jgi:hypothetical protein
MAEWNVLPNHGIERLAENLWRVVGAVPGMSLERVMTVARHGDAELVIHSAIAMDEPNMQTLQAWGTPAQLLVPSFYHCLDAPAYKARYPKIKVYAPEGSREKVQQKVPVDGGYADFPSDDTVWTEPIGSLGAKEGALWVRSNDGVTLVLNDVVMNMDKRPDFLGNLFTTLLGSAPGPRVSRLSKFALVRDRAMFRSDLERFAATPDLVRLIVAHDKVASGPNARAALLQAATYL